MPWRRFWGSTTRGTPPHTTSSLPSDALLAAAKLLADKQASKHLTAPCCTLRVSTLGASFSLDCQNFYAYPRAIPPSAEPNRGAKADETSDQLDMTAWKALGPGNASLMAKPGYGACVQALQGGQHGRKG